MDLTEKTIIIFTILGFFLILWLALMTTGCQTPYRDYGFGVNDLDKIAGANECVTDGFDWICRGPEQYITVQKVRVEMTDPVEIVIREIYLVKIIPDTVIDTPVGTIETDAIGNVVSPPEHVNIVPIDDKDPEVVDVPVSIDEDKSEVVETPREPHLPPPPIPVKPSPTEIAYLHRTTQGFWQVGFIYLDYVSLDGDQLTFLGADKRHDADDKTITVRDYRLLSGEYEAHVIARELFALVL